MHAHEKITPSRGCQRGRNVFTFISRIQPRFQTVVRAYIEANSGSVYNVLERLVLLFLKAVYL